MSGGGSGGGSSTTRTVQELAPEQQELIKLVIPEATRFVNDPPTLFPGSTIAPQTELERQGQEQALATVPGLEQQAGAGALTNLSLGSGAASGAIGLDQLIQNLGTANPALQSILGGQFLFPESNPALQATIDAAIRPIEQRFTDVVRPGIGRAATASGQFGGSRQGVIESRAGEGFLRTVGDVSSTISTQGYLAGLQQLQQTLGQVIGGATVGVGQGLEAGARGLLALPQTLQAQLFPAQVTQAVGQQQRAEDQAVLTEEANRFFAEQILPFSAAQDVANLAFGIGGGTSTTTGTASQGRSSISPFSGALGGAALGGSIGGPWGAGIGAVAGLLAGLL